MEPKLGKMYSKADAFDFERIVSHCAIENDEKIESVRKWLPELKKWLVMLAYAPQEDFVIFGPVDRLWHTFVTFTIEYAEFCDSVAGRFIHHVPADKIFEVEEKTGIVVDRALLESPQRIREIRASQVEKYRTTLAKYNEFFGPGGPVRDDPLLNELGIHSTTINPDDPDYDPDLDPLIIIWPQITPDGKVVCGGDSCCGGGCGCIHR